MKITASAESWPIKGEFRISRGTKTQAQVVVVEVERDGIRGRGEGTPYGRYGESVDSVLASIEDVSEKLGDHPAPKDLLQHSLAPGAARNALDCALWDWEANRAQKPVWQLAGLPEPHASLTAFTISLDAPEAMAEAARSANTRPLLKLKVDDQGALAAIAAIAAAAPQSRLIVDANEALSNDTFQALCNRARHWRVDLIEQPFPVDRDGVLAERAFAIAICADESAHVTADLESLVRRYDAVNIKLDKAGGLTEAIKMARHARELGLKIMLGCMVATSLGMAPAAQLMGLADFVDLDGPLLLERDRKPGLLYRDNQIAAMNKGVWGDGQRAH